jgi:hypothetical protein
MARYHINPATGNPGVCSAVEGNCPFKGAEGEESTHYPSASAAREGYEKEHGVFNAVAKLEATTAVDSVDAEASLAANVTIGSTPMSSLPAYVNKWYEQGLGGIGESLAKLRELEPGTLEHAQAFTSFAEVYREADERYVPIYSASTYDLVEKQAILERVRYSTTSTAEEKSEAAYAYLDSYVLSRKAAEMSESFNQMKDALTVHFADSPESAQELHREFTVEDERRWANQPVLPGGARDVIRLIKPSSARLANYKHLDEDFAELYEKTLIAEEKGRKSRRLFSGLRKRDSITSVK